MTSKASKQSEKDLILVWFKKLQEKRFKSVGGYRLDRWLFQFGMFAIFFWLFLIAWSSDFELDHFECLEGSDGSISGLKIMLKDYDIEGAVVNRSCRNPFYKDDWKSQEFLPYGSYGMKPGYLFRSVFWAPWIVLSVVLLFNHFFHNKKFKRVDLD